MGIEPTSPGWEPGALPLSYTRPAITRSGKTTCVSLYNTAMQLVVNGERRDVEPPPCTLADLVRTLGLEGRRIALEHNGVVVPKSLHASVELREGDRLEIVHAVGGG
jgi:sulfur carrier protein